MRGTVQRLVPTSEIEGKKDKSEPNGLDMEVVVAAEADEVNRARVRRRMRKFSSALAFYLFLRLHLLLLQPIIDRPPHFSFVRSMTIGFRLTLQTKAPLPPHVWGGGDYSWNRENVFLGQKSYYYLWMQQMVRLECMEQDYSGSNRFPND